jgi:hypothetical protein
MGVSDDMDDLFHWRIMPQKAEEGGRGLTADWRRLAQIF